MNLDHLNAQQREAATCTEGPLLILAGAGSGKTATMTHRIAYIIERGVSPYRILAVTFTNKAAGEMRQRVEKLVGACPGMWITTFHSMGLRMLREKYEAVGYERNFVVYDAVDQKTLIKNIVKRQNIDAKEYPVAYLASVISSEKEADHSPEDYRELEGDGPKAQAIYGVYREYQDSLRANNAMDFDDLLVNTLHLLRDNPQILEEYRRRFSYVMVDEYQDTNRIQYEIIKLLAKGNDNICVVGDDDQCIYQWRGADIRNILDFEKDFPDAKVIKLEQNYRSCGNILAAAYSVIKHNRGRKEKKLWTEAEAGKKIVYLRFDNDKEEAAYVAKQIELMRGAGDLSGGFGGSSFGGGGFDGGSSGGFGSFDDFAILYRTNAQSRLFEDALRRRQIPYQILSGFSFYERKETKDMISYMRLVANPRDELAFARVINEPKRGIGEKTLDKLAAIAKVTGKSLLEVISDGEVVAGLPQKAREPVSRMAQVINLCRDERENLRISDVYDNLLVKTGYMKTLEESKTAEAEARIENLMDFKSFIYDFEKEKQEAGEEATLEEFLEKVSIESDADKYESASGKVTLMTLHSAKGLEFPVVFMPGMEDGLFPGSRSLESEEKLEEERRLCYVGMTRAKSRLFLTGAEYRVKYGQGEFTRESVFMREIDPSLLDEAGDRARPLSGGSGGRLGTDTGSRDGFAAAPYKPYDALAYARRAVREKTSGSADFSPGDRVSHGKFGEGLVIEADKDTVTVIFDSVGRKKLARGIAPLKKL